MDTEWDDKAVFVAALDVPFADRDAFLRGACPDAAARARVETLLRHHAQASQDFLIPSATTADTAAANPERVDEFRILGRLGEGGMGIVYLAEDTVLGRRVALKVLAPHLTGSSDALARFVDEARSAAALKHSAIVPVFKFGFDGRNHYIASEFVDGLTLGAVIAQEQSRRKGLTSTQDRRAWHHKCAEIAAVIADALDCSHRAGIIHRDVKPSNVLIDRERGPRLTDFGIAKHVVEEARIGPTGVLGSVHYMSPEQARVVDSTVDRRSDVFSLGVVMYEMLALRKPFDGRDVHQVLDALISQEPAKLRSLDRSIAKDLETICHKALEKRPDQRYQTAAHMAADLRCQIGGDPILARPPRLLERAHRWATRHRRGLGIGLVGGLLLVVVGLVISLTWMRRAQQSEVRFTSDPSGATVRLHQLDIGSQPRTVTSATPLIWHLDPGHYHVAVVGADQLFAETSLLTKGRQRYDIHMRLLPLHEPNPDMVLIPGGVYECGVAGRDGPQALRQVTIEPFYIDAYEVSNAPYLKFIEETGHDAPPHWKELGKPPPDDRPVVGVSWHDAQAYARHHGKRLPTADEWECAMRFGDGRLTPWRDEPPADFNVATIIDRDLLEEGTRAEMHAEYLKHAMSVNSKPNWATPHGIFHAASNVNEWTDSVRSGATQIIVKGATWVRDPRRRDFAASRTVPAETGAVPNVLPTRSFSTGFRCARSVSLRTE